MLDSIYHRAEFHLNESTFYVGLVDLTCVHEIPQIYFWVFLTIEFFPNKLIRVLLN